MTHAGTSLPVYIGTYTEPAQSGNAEGIYVGMFDPATGALADVRLAARAANPSFLATNPAGGALYAVNELGGNADGSPGGCVSVFLRDMSSNDLAFLNTQPTAGTFPAHLTVDPAGRYVLAANYGTGNLAVYAIAADGSLDARTDLVRNTGSGPNAQRQEGPHAHMIAFDLSGEWAVLVDLGIDASIVYRLDPDTGTLTENSRAAATPGSGPRHIAFHPTNRFAYVLNEISATVDVFTWNADNGSLGQVQSVSTLPADFSGRQSTAEIIVHPSGRFVYASNRGHDSVAIFAVDEESGTLSARGHQPTGGQEPRSIALDPSGSFLLAANQRSDTIVTFAVDPSSGALTPTGQETHVPTPVCVLFAKP